MGRTLRSKKLRAALWIAANGKCQACGCDLPKDWHADHVVPWSITGRTNVHEMQALCPACNLSKGNRVMQLRRFQQAFGDLCNEHVSDAIAAERDGRIMVYVTPGGGKSLLPVLAARSWVGRCVDKVCWVVPRLSLAYQGEADVVASQSWLQHNMRLRKADNNCDPARDADGYITTYQAISANPQLHSDEFSRWRYALILDECHHVIEGKDWHKAIAGLYDLARRRVLMSGSWETNHGEPIAFVPYIREGGAIVPAPADIRYSRQQAIHDRAILEIDFHHFDGTATWVAETGERVVKSSFTDDVEGVMLSVALQTAYANSLLESSVTHMLQYRQTFKEARLIVVAPRQSVAKEYQDFVKERFPSLAVGIAVSCDTKNAQASINKFKHGKLDVLVTVAMAYEGLNVPQATHLACLTHYRSKPWIEQMCARVVRNAAGKTKGFVFVPDDAEMNAVIEQIRQEQLAGLAMRRDTERVGSGDREIVNGSVVPLHGDVTVMRVSALDGDEISAEETQAARMLMDQFAFRVDSIVGFVALCKHSGIALKSEIEKAQPPAIAPSAAEEILRGKIQTACSAIDRRLGRKFGTTNSEVKRHFGSRESMSDKGLERVWAYLQREYGNALAS